MRLFLKQVPSEPFWVSRCPRPANERAGFPGSARRQADPRTDSTALVPEAPLLLGPNLSRRQHGYLSTSSGSFHTIKHLVHTLWTGLSGASSPPQKTDEAAATPFTYQCTRRESFTHREAAERASGAVESHKDLSVTCSDTDHLCATNQVTSPSKPQIPICQIGMILFLNSFPLWFITGYWI